MELGPYGERACARRQLRHVAGKRGIWLGIVEQEANSGPGGHRRRQEGDRMDVGGHVGGDVGPLLCYCITLLRYVLRYYATTLLCLDVCQHTLLISDMVLSLSVKYSTLLSYCTVGTWMQL